MNTDIKLMMKCDLCYDRTSVGKKPMCATVCPSQALFYGTPEELAELRPNSQPVNSFLFGAQVVTTRVSVLVPQHSAPVHLDVLEALYDPPSGNLMEEALF
jgi:Fe-S-cluster-containing dehydrogenase component